MTAKPLTPRQRRRIARILRKAAQRGAWYSDHGRTGFMAAIRDGRRINALGGPLFAVVSKRRPWSGGGEATVCERAYARRNWYIEDWL